MHGVPETDISLDANFIIFSHEYQKCTVKAKILFRWMKQPASSINGAMLEMMDVWKLLIHHSFFHCFFF